MGNMCSAAEQATVNVGKTCYKVNGQEACEVFNAQNSKMQGLGQFISCAVSALIVFLVMDRKKLISKIVLGLTVLCLIAGIVNYFMARKQESDIVSGKPKC